MAFVLGHYTIPVYQAILLGAGANSRLRTVDIVQGDFLIAIQDTYYKFVDKATGGPYIVLGYNIDPDAAYDNAALKIVADGSFEYAVTGMDPTGNNFLIGAAFSEQIAGSGDSSEPTISAVWCDTGFELWAYRTSTFAYYAQYLYYQLEWV